MSASMYEGLFGNQGAIARRTVKDGLMGVHANLVEADEYLEGLVVLAERKIGPQLNVKDLLLARLSIYKAMGCVSNSMLVPSEEELAKMTPESRQKFCAELIQANRDVLEGIGKMRSIVIEKLNSLEPVV